MLGLGAFAAGQFALGLLLLARPGPLCDPDFAARLDCLRRRMSESPRPCTVLFLGSSRVEQGVRCGRMEGPLSAALGRRVVAFNFGKPAGTVLRSLLYWQRLRRHGVQPDLLVVELMPSLLGDHFDDLTEEHTPTALMSWDDLVVLERYGAPARRSVRRDWWRALACPAHSLRRALLSKVCPALLAEEMRLQKRPMANDSGDAVRQDDDLTPERHAEALRLTRIGFGPDLRAPTLSERKGRALRELLGSCRKAGVPVALLITPEGPMFRSLYAPGRWEALLGQLHAEAAAGGAALINAHDWIDDENDFRDSHHLTAAAAEQFSQRLACEGLLPLLDASTPPAGAIPAALGRAR